MITNLPISQIRPDLKQPRQLWNEEELKELAQNIKSHGIINPIELDETNMIVTGERRFRAAKIAGLKEVPTFQTSKEFNNPDERFCHQMAENMNHSTMNPIDMAKGINRLADYYVRTKKTTEHYVNDYLGKKLGLSYAKIKMYRSLTRESQALQDMVAQGEATPTLLKHVSYAPDKFKKAIEQKVLQKEITDKNIMSVFVQALRNGSEEDQKKLLKGKYIGMKGLQDIHKIVPSDQDFVRKALMNSEDSQLRVLKAAKNLLQLMEDYPPECIPAAYLQDTQDMLKKVHIKSNALLTYTSQCLKNL